MHRGEYPADGGTGSFRIARFPIIGLVRGGWRYAAEVTTRPLQTFAVQGTRSRV